MSEDDLTTAYLLGAEQMRDRLHKQADEIERLRAENEKLREELERLKSIDFLTSAVRSGFLYDKVEDK